MKILCIGDLVADLVVPIDELPLRAGKHQLANECMFVAGGTSNTLIVAARLGLNVQAVGAIGNDWLGKLIIEQLQLEGVSVEYVDIVDGASTSISIELLDSKAQHVFVGALGQGTPVISDIDLDIMLSDVKAIFCTSYALGGHSLFSSESSLNMLRYAFGSEIPTFFDLGPAAFSTERNVIEQAIKCSNVVLTTEEEIRIWTDCDSIGEATKSIFGLGSDIIVIKLGEKGCLIISPNQDEIYIEGFEVPVRDTAGAGDAFAGAYMYSYLKNYDHYQSGCIANATGAITVTRVGTGPYVARREEISALLETRGLVLRK